MKAEFKWYKCEVIRVKEENTELKEALKITQKVLQKPADDKKVEQLENNGRKLKEAQYKYLPLRIAKQQQNLTDQPQKYREWRPRKKN